jgi:membrane-bound lytic murein transglycosylase D
MRKTLFLFELNPRKGLPLLLVIPLLTFILGQASINAQLRNDPLTDSSLHHIISDVAHNEFHPETNFFDTLFYSYIPSVDIETIEDRASCLDLDIPMVVNKSVCSFIHYFTVRKRNYTQTMLERKNYYFPIFEYYLRKYEMPDALKYLAIVESGLNFKAKSKVGALGLWQFMPGTGRDFRLQQTTHLDQRQNPWLATEAACRFLKSLHNTFGDWELALAAYNCGPGNVMKAMRKSGKRGFWEIYTFLPQETRSYVPQFHAVVYSMNYAREHNIHPDVDSVLVSVPLDSFPINKTFDLKKLESILGMTPRSLHQFNPEVRSTVFPGGVLLVPGSHSYLLASNLDLFIDSARVVAPPVVVKPEIETGYAYIKKGSSIKTFTKKRGISSKEFCQLNNLHGDKIKKSGRYRLPSDILELNNNALVSKLDSGKVDSKTTGKAIESKLASVNEKPKSIKRPGKSKTDLGQADSSGDELNPKLAAAKNGSGTAIESETVMPEFHLLGRGEGLFSVARKYGTDLSRIKELNPGLGNFLTQGQKVRLRSSNSEKAVPSSRDSNLVASNPVSTELKCLDEPKTEISGLHPIHKTRAKLYEVQKGDTLYSITRKLGRLTVKDLIRLNKLKNKQIKPGQQLIVG